MSTADLTTPPVKVQMKSSLAYVVFTWEPAKSLRGNITPPPINLINKELFISKIEGNTGQSCPLKEEKFLNLLPFDLFIIDKIKSGCNSLDF